MANKLKEQHLTSCPREKAGVFSTVTFFYTLETILRGFRSDLKEEDIYRVHRKLDSEVLARRLEELCPKGPETTGLLSIIKILLTCFYRQLLLITFLDTVYKIVLTNLTALAIGKLVDHFSPSSTITATTTYYYAAFILLFKLTSVFYLQNFLLCLFEFALKTKTAFSSLIYRKCLKLEPEAISNHNAGKIVTLITKDVGYVQEFMIYLSNFFTEIVQDLVIVYNIHATVGPTAYVGVGVLLSVLPLHLYLNRKINRLRLELGKKSDHRLETTKETLSFIKIIKMYTWELWFADKISKIRREEVVTLRTIQYLQGVIYATGFLICQIALYVVLTISSSNEGTTPEDTFYVISCFAVLEFTYAKCLTSAGIAMTEMMAGVKRIFTLLNSEDLPRPITRQNGDKVIRVTIKNASVRIGENVVLNKSSCTLDPGLNVITGPLGSGKTVFLKMILKEYHLTEGSLNVQGTVSYAGQEPWLFPGTIKKNIVFGGETNEERYQQVLSVCALNYDLESLSDGDQTIVEDNGTNLSKGQQARINLARAMYRESSIYLLDDCLVALDVGVQTHIFKRCIKEFLRGKICVFVTQNPKHIKEAGQLIILNEGTLTASVAPEKPDLEQLCKSIAINRDFTATEETRPEKQVLDEKNVRSEHEEYKLIPVEKAPSNLYREMNKIGTVDLSIYKRYIDFGGGLTVFLFIIFVIVGDQLIASYREKAISNWVNLLAESASWKHRNLTNSTEYEKVIVFQKQSYFTYSMLICANVVTTMIKTLCFSYYICKICTNIHTSMIKNVVTATMDFFDNNFVGIILNRFSTDLSTIDDKLNPVLMELIKISGDILTTFILVAMIHPMYLIPTTVVMILLLLLRWFYMPACRSLKRLGNGTRSSLVGHINSTLSGITTIRAFGQEQKMISEFDEYLNVNTSSLHMSLMLQTAFGAYVSLLSFIYVCYIVVDLLIFNTTEAGDVGLILMKSFKLSDNIEVGIQAWAFLETLLTAVERVLEFTDVQTENQMGREVQKWPNDGELEYEKVSLSYPKTRETSLKNLSFKVAPREKIGIVGRTGAGKSSLISVLFRLYDVDGKIVIDNEDIKTISLRSLRAHVSVIPQESVIFRGTVRDNLDPKREFSDKNIWLALQKVGLTGVIPDLESSIGDEGLELSAGQKQLFSIARALLRENRIVVLDEPTASMDPEHDSLIKDVVETEFAACTVLNIAHKLDSVAECDGILVMDRGEKIEFEATQTLLNDPESHFYKMVHMR